jgi:hypothetical protein
MLASMARAVAFGTILDVDSLLAELESGAGYADATLAFALPQEVFRMLVCCGVNWVIKAVVVVGT